jgi:phosphoglycolate phosphatase-like HAD superfamily hydrolase
VSEAQPVTHVLLWDVDGTLLTTARAGVFALEEAAREVLGIEPDFKGLATAGLTDSEVVELCMETAGLDPDPAEVERFLRAYERLLPDRLSWRQGSVMPGVCEVLDELTSREDVASLLLTGNTPAGARAKLRHYGLWDYFEGGAFCEAVEPREAVARRALELATDLLGPDASGDRIFVIGDTPADVRVGKAIGAKTVAVASGPSPVEELEATEPWLVLPAIPEPDAFFAALGLDGGAA